MKTHKLALSLTALIFSVATASVTAAPITAGTVIGIDFSDVGGLQTNFNLVDPLNGSSGAAGSGSLAAPLIETSAGTDVDGVAFSWASTSNWFNNGDSLSYATQPAVFSDASTTDWIGISGNSSVLGTITLTFTGLDDSLSYDLIIGARFNSGIADVTWVADGQSDTTDASSDADAYVTLTGLSSTGGTLEITGTGTGGTGGRQDIVVVSALALTAVPEPGSLALLGLGGLCLIKRRRRD